MYKPSTDIKTWEKFGRVVRSRGCSLLSRLDDFPNSILVTGCQRSGTTILSRVITKSDGMQNFWFGPDDELDAALILSGTVEYAASGRHCFQTTYLNECFREYFEHKNDHKVVWVLRNPFSVVHSMLYNWKSFALNELFAACAIDRLDPKGRKRFKRFGVLGVSRLKRACLAYCGKVSQLFSLIKGLDSEMLIVVEYEKLVSHKEELLPKIYDFIGLEYHANYADMIHKKSLSKHNALSKKEHLMVQEQCLPVYHKAKELVTSL